MEQRNLTKEEWKLVAIRLGRKMFYRGLQIGFLAGLTVGWIAGGLVMLWLS